MVREYRVVSQDFHWWVLLDGVRLGPYLSSTVAEASAVSSAKHDFKVGQSACVIVEEDQDRIVYDSDIPGYKYQ